MTHSLTPLPLLSSERQVPERQQKDGVIYDFEPDRGTDQDLVSKSTNKVEEANVLCMASSKASEQCNYAKVLN